MNQVFFITEQHKKDVLAISDHTPLKKVAEILNIPYYIVLQIVHNDIADMIYKHQEKTKENNMLHYSQGNKRARERFFEAPLLFKDGVTYKIVKSDENEWIKND